MFKSPNNCNHVNSVNFLTEKFKKIQKDWRGVSARYTWTIQSFIVSVKAIKNEIRNETSGRVQPRKRKRCCILFPFPQQRSRRNAECRAPLLPVQRPEASLLAAHIQYIEVGNDSWNVVRVIRVSTLSQKRCVNRMRLIWLRGRRLSLAKEKETTGATTIITRRRRGKEARRGYEWTRREMKELFTRLVIPFNPLSDRRLEGIVRVETETIRWIEYFFDGNKSCRLRILEFWTIER